MNENEFVEAVRLLLPGMYVLPHPSPPPPVREERICTTEQYSNGKILKYTSPREVGPPSVRPSDRQGFDTSPFLTRSVWCSGNFACTNLGQSSAGCSAGDGAPWEWEGRQAFSIYKTYAAYGGGDGNDGEIY